MVLTVLVFGEGTDEHKKAKSMQEPRQVNLGATVKKNWCATMMITGPIFDERTEEQEREEFAVSQTGKLGNPYQHESVFSKDYHEARIKKKNAGQ